MSQKLKLILIPFILIIVVSNCFTSCDKEDGGRLPLPPMNITINPNSTIYSEINMVGGWMYLDETDGVEPPSRGVIVYRADIDLFYAYERTPPFMPDSCCNASKTVCTSLFVDFPFVMDTCTVSKYLILDGSVVSGPSNMSLSMYVTEYYGGLLYIHD